MLWRYMFVLMTSAQSFLTNAGEFPLRVCEPIRIDMCRGIGYNETSMPNLVGHELQSDVEFTLQTFAPLIELVCSTQLKLFLCAAYVPMCTPKVPVPIGPCRSLCESVRSRCHPVLQSFGFPWPHILDCSHFPLENNHETMCMEVPDEDQVLTDENDIHPGVNSNVVPQMPQLECPGFFLRSHLYVKLHWSGRCALLCEADALFSPNEKHLAELWITTWTYATLCLSIVATFCLMIFKEQKRNTPKWSRVLTPLVWCHDMVTVGWAVRFFSGRNETACGYDPQLPNVSLLLVDGLSNASCAATFLLRYYFGMASCVWWSILCLGWHRDVRCSSPDSTGNIALGNAYTTPNPTNRSARSQRPPANRKYSDITQTNLALFTAWGLPAFQTAAVIVARLVDADELLGACFVGNQSDKGLQILVATPLFCYWIFGSMNLISGYLVHRRNIEIFTNMQTSQPPHQMPLKNSRVGIFLFFYCIPFTILLTAVIYEFANIDIWLNAIFLSSKEKASTPLWPFLTRAFMELTLGVICFVWVLGPKISVMCKQQLAPRTVKVIPSTSPSTQDQQGSRSSNIAYSTVSYQTIRQGPHLQKQAVNSLPLNHLSKHPLTRSKCAAHIYVNRDYKINQPFNRYGNETIL